LSPVAWSLELGELWIFRIVRERENELALGELVRDLDRVLDLVKRALDVVAHGHLS